MRWLCLLFATLLAGCGGSGGSSGGSCTTNLCTYAGLLAPTSGWETYGTGTGYAGVLNNPFTIPAKSSGKSINYVYTAPPALAVGKTITLNYSVDGTATFGPADPSDVAPATIALFIWENGDTGGETGRYWCATRPNLVLGDNQTLSCVINSTWTDVDGKAATPGPNAFAVGFTFGGQYFAGHGVWATSGSATFKVNSYTVQ